MPRKYHFIVIAVIFALLVIIHYHEAFSGVWILERINSFMGLGLTRQTFGRILFLIPITYGAAALGPGAGISILLLSAAAMFPRVFYLSVSPREALLETIGIIFTGVIIVLLIEVVQKARRRYIELEATRKLLDIQVERLSMLHALSSAVSQSLKLEEILTAVDMTRQLIKIRASWLYLYDEEKKRLVLATSKGLPETALPEAVPIGEGPDGQAASSRQVITVESTPADSTATSLPGNRGGLQSILVVPLISKDELVGTLGMGSRLAHHFSQDEVDLVRATADELCMALVNARLYEKEQKAAEALRVSERNYRELFESASDAIWVHDLNGKILTMNSAFERLTGYERASLLNSNISELLPSHDQSRMDKEAHDIALRGETPEPTEQELIRKDGSIVVIETGTSLIIKDGQPWAFQHIARDITENKKAQDNLRFYIQQVSHAQEAERKRIARELHDVTAQALVTIVRNLDDLASGRAKLTVKEIQEQVRDILKEIRRFSQQLRPSVLDDLGLVPAIKWLAADLNKNYGINVSVEVDGEPRQLTSDAEMMLFRIIQEALNNAQKHSGAKEVSVMIEFNRSTTKVRISDNGAGFAVPPRIGDLARNGKLGLAGMQERAQLLGGTLAIDSEPGKGTSLIVEIPS